VPPINQHQLLYDQAQRQISQKRRRVAGAFLAALGALLLTPQMRYFMRFRILADKAHPFDLRCRSARHPCPASWPHGKKRSRRKLFPVDLPSHERTEIAHSFVSDGPIREKARLARATHMRGHARVVLRPIHICILCVLLSTVMITRRRIPSSRCAGLRNHAFLSWQAVELTLGFDIGRGIAHHEFFRQLR
jgi:hypothetical protein